MRRNLDLILIALIIGIIFISLASAFDNIGTYRLNQDLNLNLGCSFNNTYCPDTFVCNISIFNENGLIINNQIMSNTLYPQYNYTIIANNLTKTGLYYGRQVCCGIIGCNDYSLEFMVNAQGKEYGQIQGTIYAILLAILIGVFAFSLYTSIKIESDDIRGSEGELIRINWKKYLKFFMFAITYVSFMGITYFAWNISYGILEFPEMAGFFNFLFTLSYIVIFPIGSFVCIYLVISFITDKKNQKMLERGLYVT